MKLLEQIVDLEAKLDEKKQGYGLGTGEAAAATVTPSQQRSMASIAEKIEGKIGSLIDRIDKIISEKRQEFAKAYPGLPHEVLRFECLKQVLLTDKELRLNEESALEMATQIANQSPGAFSVLSKDSDPLYTFIQENEIMDKLYNTFEPMIDLQDKLKAQLFRSVVQAHANIGSPRPRDRNLERLETFMSNIKTVGTFAQFHGSTSSRADVSDRLLDALEGIRNELKSGFIKAADTGGKADGVTLAEVEKCIQLCAKDKLGFEPPPRKRF